MLLELVKSVRENEFNPNLQIAGYPADHVPVLATVVSAASGRVVDAIYVEAFHVFERPIEYSIKVAECPAPGRAFLTYAPKKCRR